MSKATLYLLIGYPGAGKTTVSKTIASQTGATHLWADAERHKLFSEPTHSLEESNELYAKLNERAEQLLKEGKSVVFDTNFNFYSDRQLLRDIANKYNAETVLVWVTTPVEVARDRAVCDHETRNGYQMTMTNEQFDAIVSKLEPPKDNEATIKIDGENLDNQTLIELLKKLSP